jgi:hypothetical protein
VNANLSFIDKLFSSTESWKKTSVQSDQSSAEAESRADSSLTPGGAGEQIASISNPSFDSRDSQVSEFPKHDETTTPKMPPTPLESLRDQYGRRSTVLTAASTDSNNSASSRLSSMSTSTARFQEIDARIQRQQKEFDRKDRINTERLERMERQFTRFDDLDHRFYTMEENLMNVMEKQAGVGTTMNKLSDKISALMDMIAQVNIQTDQAPVISTLTSEAITTKALAVEDPDQKSFVPVVSDRQLDRVSFSSPIKKKYRAGSQSNNPEEIGDRNADNRTEVFLDCQTPQSVTIAALIDDLSHNKDLESLSPISQAVRIPMPDDNHMDFQPTMQAFEDITTDLESRYQNKSSQGGGPGL